MRPAEFLLVPIGSAGDVHPYAGVGRELARRGHHVRLIANAYFAPVAQRADLDFVESGPAEEYLRTIADPDLWNPAKSYTLMFEKMLEAMAVSYRLVEKLADGRKLPLVSPSANLGARVAEESLGLPLVSMNVEVNIFRSVQEWPGRDVPPKWQRAIVPMRRAIMYAMDKWFFDPQLGPRLNEFRAQLGLRQPVRRIMREWIHSPHCVIGLFPEWFSGRFPDWPANLHLTGFPLYDDGTARPLSAEDESFLANGPPPVVFTFGSARRAAAGQFATAVEICRRLNRRGVLLTEFAGQTPASLPDSVRHVSYAPLSQLLPRAAALVHHGGVGTTAQGLRAGIPQLVTPMVFDQPYNAVRLRRLGAGRSLAPEQFTPETATAVLRELLASPEVAARCRETAERMASDADTLSRTCDVIEEAACGS